MFKLTYSKHVVYVSSMQAHCTSMSPSYGSYLPSLSRSPVSPKQEQMTRQAEENKSRAKIKIIRDPQRHKPLNILAVSSVIASRVVFCLRVGGIETSRLCLARLGSHPPLQSKFKVSPSSFPGVLPLKGLHFVSFIYLENRVPR